ncbi:MAG: hypothetical protein O2985_03255 [Proteobacteria bacterium]|nr:hypothetical protein [Pseudomonadota bacterium]
MAYPSNQPSLADLARLDAGDIAELPAETLLDLQRDVEAALKTAKADKARIDDALIIKYTGHAARLRAEQGKDTGTVRFQDGDVTVSGDLPKRVDWDQAMLADLVDRIRAAGDDPGEYVDLAFKVPERKYTAWPETIRTEFEPARTVRVGKPSFHLCTTENQ